MGIYEDIKPHELADLRVVADKLSGTAAGERMHALLDAYEEMQDPDEIATLEQVEPLVKMVDTRFDQVKKIHALLDEDEKARQEREKAPKRAPASEEKTAGEVVEAIEARLDGLEEALDDLQTAAEDLGPVRETKAEYYGALEEISTKQTELYVALEGLGRFAELEDKLLELAENGDMEAASKLWNTVSPATLHELAKAWKLARDFAEHVRDTAGAHV